MILDENGYPDEITLKQIETFDLGQKFGNLYEYLVLIKKNWWYPEWKYDPKTGCLQISTFGWSGNESIITTMEKNYFWFWFWYKSKRGGHYWFKLFQFDETGKQCLPKFWTDEEELADE